MQCLRKTSAGLSSAWSVVLFATALLVFIASGLAIRRFPALTPSDSDAFMRVDLIFPCVGLWFTYWAIFHASAYLRPRTVLRELELFIPAFVLLCVSWWIRVIVLTLGHGM
jgi:hypothetical protein